MALKHFLDTGELPGNILELAVIKKINLYSFVVGDHSCLAELNLADNPIHAKIIDTGTTIKLIKPFSEDGKIIQAHKNFKPLKSKTNIIISPSAEELAQFESIEEDNSKINNIKVQNNLTTFNFVKEFDTQVNLPTLTVMVIKITRILQSKFGKYQIADLMDIEGNKASINLYDGSYGKMEFEKIYTMTKVKKILPRKEDSVELRLVTSKFTKIVEANENDALQFANLSIGNSQIDGTIIGFSDINHYKSCVDHWKKLDDDDYCPLCKGPSPNIKDDFHTDLYIQDSNSDDLKSFLIFRRTMKRMIADEDDEDTIESKLNNLEGSGCKVDYDEDENGLENASIIPKRLKLQD